MLSRRSFLKSGAATLGMLAMGVSVTQASPMFEDSVEPLSAEPAMPFTPYQTNYLPTTRYVLADDRNICPKNMGFYYPHMRNLAVPAVYRTGQIPTCTVPTSQFDNAQGFKQGSDALIINPNGFIRPVSMVSTFVNTPQNPNMDPNVFRDLAIQPTIDKNIKKMRLLGVWGMPVDESVAASNISNPGQAPDSPVDWGLWKDMETGGKLDDINRESGPIVLELSPGLDPLYTSFISGIGDSKTLQQLCPSTSGLGNYFAELISVFPMIDMRGPIPFAEMWAHIRHTDDRVEALCSGDIYKTYEYIQLESLLVGTPAAIRGEAQRRVERETRIWPIQGLELQPLGGGISQETLGQAAMFAIGALVVIAIVAIVLSQPQLILVAAVAL